MTKNDDDASDDDDREFVIYNSVPTIFHLLFCLIGILSRHAHTQK